MPKMRKGSIGLSVRVLGDASLHIVLFTGTFYRLTSLSRWRPITKGELRTRGAKYFTFVYPRETLATRQFPDHGTFAYLFRYLSYIVHD